MKEHTVKITQVVGAIVLLAALFGVEIDAVSQQNLITGLSGAGLVVTTIADIYQKWHIKKNQQVQQ